METPDQIYESILNDFLMEPLTREGNVPEALASGDKGYYEIRKRGRPRASRSGRESELATYEAFVIVFFLQKKFRDRFQTKRVPERVTHRFLELVIEDFCQEASFEAALLRVRRNKQQPLPN